MAKSGEKWKMFLGNFTTKLDLKKGRTALPQKFRKLVGNKIIITAGYEKTLMIIDLSSWEKVVGEIVNKSFISHLSRDTDRFLLGLAFEAELDKQGRFIIPTSLREYAGLKENIVFVGVGNRIEVWSAEAWEKHKDYLDKNIERIAQELDEQEK